MNKYLIEILKIKTSVILPGFGALMVANKKTGKIVLNKHLKFDDGVLAKYISEQEGIDITEAKNMVSKFVREIESVIGKGDTYDIFQFGKISKNEKGDLFFEMDPSLKTEQSSPIVSTPKKEVAPTKKVEEKPANTFVPPVKKEEVKKEIPKKEEPKKIVSKKEEVKPVIKKEESKTVKKKVEETKKNTYVPPVQADAKKSEKVVKKEVSKEKVAEKSDPKKDAKAIEAKKKKDAKALAAKKKEEAKLATAKAKKEKAAKKKEVVLGPDGKPVKKKKKRLIPLLLLLIAIGCMGFAGYKYQDKIKEMIGYTSVNEDHELVGDVDGHDSDEEHGEEHAVSEDFVTSEEDTLNDETLVEDETTVEEDVVEETEEVVEDVVEEVAPVVESSVNGSYHIIGGGFGVESNATAYANKNGGTVLGRFDDLYLVALKSYDSKAEAQADLSNVRNTSSSAWIFKYSK